MWSGRFGESAGHPDEPNLAVIPEALEGADGVLGLHQLPGGRHVHLHQIEVIRLEASQAPVQARPDVVAAEVVRVGRPRGPRGRVAEKTTALGRQEASAPVGEESTDQLLAVAIVDRGVDEIDSVVEHSVEDAGGLLVGGTGPARLAGSSMAP